MQIRLHGNENVHYIIFLNYCCVKLGSARTSALGKHFRRSCVQSNHLLCSRQGIAYHTTLPPPRRLPSTLSAGRNLLTGGKGRYYQVWPGPG